MFKIKRFVFWNRIGTNSIRLASEWDTKSAGYGFEYIYSDQKDRDLAAPLFFRVKILPYSSINTI